MTDWNVEKSQELYGIDNWGADYFSVNPSGHIEVRPRGAGGPGIDLLALTEDLRRRDLRTPMLIRFSDVLASRIGEICGAFAKAINEYGYTGRYRGVYPIKVNQQRHVVEEVVRFGAPFGVGLEAGSKPELLVALAALDTPGALIICNGFKDQVYIETALLAQRLGRTPVIVVDRFHELELIIKTARELGIRPHIGLRARLSALGAGRWLESGGRRSKFGLSPVEIVQAVERLKAEDMIDCLELLHFHIGSQITAIQAHKKALREVGQIFIGLHALGASQLKLIDVGGGLGVDYDGSKSDFHSSMNYSIQEYANDVVDAVLGACEQAGIPHPDIVSESGRGIVAHHSVLVFDVIGADRLNGEVAPGPVFETDHKVLRDMNEIRHGLDRKNFLEGYHDAVALRDEAISLFALGHLDLPNRARADHLFMQCCRDVLAIVRDEEEVPEDLCNLERDLADTYFGNFSLFQSAPDHWAVKQLFPVVPIHRLDEEPTRRGIIADLTCDSDGKMDHFINRDEPKPVLELHSFDGRAYYLGIFLIGAYQEILGDLHNLFGDTDAVHVSLDEDGSYSVEHLVEGDDVADVLTYVQYDRRELIETVRRTIEAALRRGDISIEESTLLRKRYDQELHGYTYLSGEA